MGNKDSQQSSAETREEFLTARQLAAILQVSESTVRRLAQTGRIPAIRLTSRLLRFYLPAVREALDGDRAKRTRQKPDEAAADDAQLTFTEFL